MKKTERGFTLLEVLVATLIMGIAVSGILSGLAGAARNAARLSEYDRATILAKGKMDELLINRALPRNQTLEGAFDPSLTAGVQAGWRARVAPFEAAPGTGPGSPGIDRVELEVWWMSGETRRSFNLEGFRRNLLRMGDRIF
jgi:general secretion pathway protein I